MEEKNILKFPKKLWALINTPSEIIKWGSSGISILIDLNSLEDYLKSSESLFKLKRISSFINQLEIYGFEKISSTEYRNVFFQENCLDLLSQIERRSFFNGNLCQQLIPKNSLLYKARLSLQNELVFKTIGKCLRENAEIVEVPEEYFDNPTEIVPNYSQHEGIPGFFGNHVTNEQLKTFFSEVKVETNLIPEKMDLDGVPVNLIQSNEFMLPYESIKIDESLNDEMMDVSENVVQSNEDFSNLFSQIRESIDVLNE